VGLARPCRVWRALVWVWRCRFGQGVLALGQRCFATSCIRTAPSPIAVRPNSSILLPSRSYFDALLPGPRNPQSASPRSQSRPYFPAASFPAQQPPNPPTHLAATVQSSSLSTTTALLDPSADGTNSSNGSAGPRCSVTGERRPREPPHQPMTFKTRRV
jgi:hypothetical protein